MKRFNYGEYAPYIRRSMIPLWNMEQLPFNSTQFMVPCTDGIYCEHEFPLQGRGETDGYLILSNEDILEIRHEKKKIVLKTKKEIFEGWRILHMLQKPAARSLDYDAPFLTNHTQDSFIRRYAEHNGSRLMTKTDLFRRIMELDTGDFIEAAGYEITDCAGEALLAPDMNWFARDGSPYTEIVQETINSRDIEQNEVRLNPLYRFSREFAALFDINIADYEASRRIFFDVCMQYFIRLDLRQGLSRQEYALRFLLDDLLNGACGSQAGAVIKRFPKEKLRRLLRLVLKLYRCGSSLYLFREVMRHMYPDSLVYAGNEAAREVLVYVGVKENGEEQERLEFLRDMFLLVYYEVYLFWDHHFGIMDVDETMEMDEMVLF